METILKYYEQITDPIFWEQIIDMYKSFGIIMPILFAFIESVIPALPLTAIVAWNIFSYGPIMGSIYSWIGTTLGSITMFIFYRFIGKKYLIKYLVKFKGYNRMNDIVENGGSQTLFILAMVPFTPSALINVAYGLSGFSKKSFIKTIFLAKIVNTSLLAAFGDRITASIDNPINLIVAFAILLAIIAISQYVNRRYKLNSKD